jgi:hypothetical protein
MHPLIPRHSIKGYMCVHTYIHCTVIPYQSLSAMLPQGNCPQLWWRMSKHAIRVHRLTIWLYADIPTIRCTINITNNVDIMCRQTHNQTYYQQTHYALWVHTTHLVSWIRPLPPQHWMYCITSIQHCGSGSCLALETNNPPWAISQKKFLVKSSTYSEHNIIIPSFYHCLGSTPLH